MWPRMWKPTPITTDVTFTAGQPKHNSSNVGGVTAGQLGHNSSNNNVNNNNNKL